MAPKAQLCVALLVSLVMARDRAGEDCADDKTSLLQVSPAAIASGSVREHTHHKTYSEASSKGSSLASTMVSSAASSKAAPKHQTWSSVRSKMHSKAHSSARAKMQTRAHSKMHSTRHSALLSKVSAKKRAKTDAKECVPPYCWEQNPKPEEPSSTPHSEKECQDFCGWRTNVNLCIWSCKKALAAGLEGAWAGTWSDPYSFGNIARSWVRRADPIQTWFPSRGGVPKQMGGRWPKVAKSGNSWFDPVPAGAMKNAQKMAKFEGV